MSYDAVIVDNDGVLTKPTPTNVHRAAVRAAFSEFGVEPTTEGVDGVVHGSLTHVRRVCEVHGVDYEEFWPRHEANAAAAQAAAIERGEKTLYDDVSALVDLDRTLALVSNNQHETVETILEAFELDSLFEVAYGRDPTVEGYRNRKPSPHYLERAIDELDAERVLYVGDSNVDVLAASRAGADSAFVRRPHREDYRLAGDPTYEVQSLADVASLC
ncbi:haloacid dehalogenase superfamily, subfamily IA, variant 1 with third motif having Dx(3-4)D or Dx(3-4)E [Halogeometricum rufum]|uniref:Haloacid dehalogenase superfamily, subfamily IA, variant 1 with third motif having Dx(3-4)D or Dx(3-4)E n=1 Tax=Halogeometricum rufum TaxID=553469 RepID=A0A1I6I986_9EURY|nr:HAD family hydrolase [Halogeometricum rufum]SFR63241.1 haloacid dehalogenase superfamily, subfamily IA, variant 1 with third motif having Dx(3-4)D or Dx(3-4)E [Halogeometricum rufum]